MLRIHTSDFSAAQGGGLANTALLDRLGTEGLAAAHPGSAHADPGARCGARCLLTTVAVLLAASPQLVFGDRVAWRLRRGPVIGLWCQLRASECSGLPPATQRPTRHTASPGCAWVLGCLGAWVLGCLGALVLWCFGALGRACCHVRGQRGPDPKPDGLLVSGGAVARAADQPGRPPRPEPALCVAHAA